MINKSYKNFLILSLLFMSSIVTSQSITGNIEVIVTANSSGKALAGVTLILTPPPTSAENIEITDQYGMASFLDLYPNLYKINAELAGYNTKVQKNIEIYPGHSATIKIKLELAD